jgi:hypothetical protein
MSGWSAPFAKRVLQSWKVHSRLVGAEAVADQIRSNIKAKAVETSGRQPETADGGAGKIAIRSKAAAKR